MIDGKLKNPIERRIYLQKSKKNLIVKFESFKSSID